MKYLSATRRATVMSILVVGVWCASSPVHAVFFPRYQATQKGSFVLVGNTLARDAATGTPAPIVGTVGSIGTFTNDGSPDVFWRSDFPGPGAATASLAIPIQDARSTANLAIPAGSTITHAQLYWSGARTTDPMDKLVTFSRDGGFSANVGATGFVTVSNVDGNFYQSTANVTSLVQAAGPGTFRLETTSQSPLANLQDEVVWAGWSLVVAYSNPAEPVRQITIQDGLDLIANPSIYNVSRPSVGVGTAQMGIVVYEGDPGGGDLLRVNGVPISNALNPMNDVFNWTYSRFGASASSVGDLPRLTGASRSMSGIDIDTFDVTPMLGSSLNLNSIYTAGGRVYNGVIVTALPVVGVPEPGTMLLAALGGMVLLCKRRNSSRPEARLP